MDELQPTATTTTPTPEPAVTTTPDSTAVAPPEQRQAATNPALVAIAHHPEFQMLDLGERRKALAQAFPKFAGLPPQDQDAVLGSLGSVRQPRRVDRYLPAPVATAVHAVADLASPQNVAGAAGGLIGDAMAPAFGPLAPLVPPMMSGLAGAGAQLLRNAGGAMLGEDPADMQSAQSAGASQAVAEGVGRAVMPPILRGLSLVSQDLLPKLGMKFVERPGVDAAATDAVRVLQPAADKLGVTENILTPGQVRPGGPVGVLEALASKGMFAGRLQDHRQTTIPRLVNTTLDGLVAQFGEHAAPDEIGRALTDSVKRGSSAATDLVAPFYYNKVEDGLVQFATKAPRNLSTSVVAPGADTVPVPFDVRALRDEFRAKLPSAQKLQGISGEAAGDDLLRYVAGLPDTLTFKEAQSLRTRLRLVRQNKDLPEQAPARALAGKAEQTVDRIMDEKLTSLDPELAEWWRTGNAVVKSSNEQYGNDLVRKLVDLANPKLVGQAASGNAAGIADAVFQKGNTEVLQAVKNAAHPETYGQLQRSFLEQQIEAAGGPNVTEQLGRSVVPTAGKLKSPAGTTLREKIVTALGPDTYREAFTAPQRHDLERVLNAIETAQDHPGGNSAISWINTGALVGVTSAALAAAGLPAAAGANAAVILLAPKVLSSLFLSREGSKAFTHMLETNPTSRAAGPAFLRLKKAVSDAQAQSAAYGRQTEADAANLPAPLRERFGVGGAAGAFVR